MAGGIGRHTLRVARRPCASSPSSSSSSPCSPRPRRAHAAPTARPAAGRPGRPRTSTPSGRRTAPESRVWFTLRQREMTEVYYPDLGTPAVRSLEFAVAPARGGDDRRPRDHAKTTGRWSGSTGSTTARRSPTTAATGASPRPSRPIRALRGARRRPLRVAHRAALRAARAARPAARQRRSRRPRADDRQRPRGQRPATTARSPRRPAFTATSSGYVATSDPWYDLRDDGSLDANADARSRGNVRQAATTDARRRQPRSSSRSRSASAPTRPRPAASPPRRWRRGFAAAADRERRRLGRLSARRSSPRRPRPHRWLAAYQTSLLMLRAHDDKATRAPASPRRACPGPGAC